MESQSEDNKASTGKVNLTNATGQEDEPIKIDKTQEFTVDLASSAM